MQTLEEKKHQAVWIAHSLFERGKTSGTTANLSFREGELLWVTRSGSCFGTLTEEDLIPVRLNDGLPLHPEGPKPSKELPLHQMLYQNDPDIEAVLHTHSPSAVLWSCLSCCRGRDVLPHLTPYLQMKLGAVAAVPYAAPGSPELFAQMRAALGPERGYLLSHHGPIVGGKSLMNAFEAMEELEQTAWLAWQLRSCPELVTPMEASYVSIS